MAWQVEPRVMEESGRSFVFCEKCPSETSGACTWGRFCRVRQIPPVDGRLRKSYIGHKRDIVQFYHFHFLILKFSFCLFSICVLSA